MRFFVLCVLSIALRFTLDISVGLKSFLVSANYFRAGKRRRRRRIRSLHFTKSSQIKGLFTLVTWTKQTEEYCLTKKKPRTRVSSRLLTFTTCVTNDYGKGWEEAWMSLREVLGLSSHASSPEIPRTTTNQLIQPSLDLPSSSTKRKADHNEDVVVDSGGEDIKRPKITSTIPAVTRTPSETSPDPDIVMAHAQAAAAQIPFLDVQHLLSPKLPSHEELEAILLAVRKRMLVEEYFGDTQSVQ